MNINENIALAKSILKKQSIAETDEDYLKIRELVGNSFGYVGILTRLRYVDGVEDFEELKSIFEVLKSSKLDLGKLNKMSYEQILDIFYDELTSSSKDKADYELIFKDTQYSYFRVYTYKGILEIGSPAWCLKTKSNWDAYQAKYPEQWVAIDNRYVRSAITPNNSYLGGQYVNNGKRWIRFGVSIKHNNDNTVSWVGHDDNDGRCNLEPNNCTFFGVFHTVLNLSNGVLKPYYQKFGKCEHLDGSILKITDDLAWERLGVRAGAIKSLCDDGDIAYLCLSKTYSAVPLVFILKENSIPYIMVFTKNIEILEPVEIENVTLEPSHTLGKEILKFISSPRSVQYIGLRVKLGFITIEQAMANPKYISKHNSWLVYDWNENYYIGVDSDPKHYVFPTSDTKLNMYWNPKKYGNQPIVYLIDKKTMKSDYAAPEFNDVIHSIRVALNLSVPIEQKVGKKVQKFWDFIKKQPLL